MHLPLHALAVKKEDFCIEEFAMKFAPPRHGESTLHDFAIRIARIVENTEILLIEFAKPAIRTAQLVLQHPQTALAAHLTNI